MSLIATNGKREQNEIFQGTSWITVTVKPPVMTKLIQLDDRVLVVRGRHFPHRVDRRQTPRKNAEFSRPTANAKQAGYNYTSAYLRTRQVDSGIPLFERGTHDRVSRKLMIKRRCAWKRGSSLLSVVVESGGTRITGAAAPGYGRRYFRSRVRVLKGLISGDSDNKRGDEKNYGKKARQECLSLC
ncbi:hypothetical protein M405DRAFT_840320 [Rhizopogon salebrosus TDB-379]|nr:hypothetical protein M405DRAFT_840320 [Rhizopogon salebrosus TDB-379]